jgi:hypothetical protein
VTCPIDGCTETKKRPDDVVCIRHWMLVPPSLKTAIVRWWWAQKRNPDDLDLVKAHRIAAAAAIEAVHRIEARRRARAARA